MKKKKYLAPHVTMVAVETEAGFSTSGPANTIDFEMILNDDTPAANSGKYNDQFNETNISDLW